MPNHRNTPRPSTSKPQNKKASPTGTSPKRKPTAASLHNQILADFATLRVPLSGEQFDQVLRAAEQQGLSHLEFLQRLVGTQAQQRRERAVERRIREACFREVRLLEDFDWEFNAAAIDRVQIEQLATGEFLRRGEVWADYLDDPALAMALMDRVVDSAIRLNIDGKSYRVHRAQRAKPPSQETKS